MTRAALVVRESGSMGGISRYVHELLRGLEQSDDVDARLFTVATHGDWSLAPSAEVARLPTPFGGSLALLRLPWQGTDVVHFPTHESFPVFAALRPPVVMTIHSVEPLFLSESDVFGGRAPRFWRLPYHLLRLARSRLRLVVTPSQATAIEIERHLRVPRERIRVIPHGVGATFTSSGEAFVLPTEVPYVLHVSHHQPQKNVVRLIEAFADLDMGLDLVIGGDTTRCASAYAAAVERHGLQRRVHFLGPVTSDDVLATLYRGALAFVMPSLQESFGMPVLEAMACACPVVVSSGTGARETAGDSAIVIDPRSASSIAAAIERVRDDAGERARMAELGLVRSREFTWERSVAAHIDAYLEAAQ